MSDHIRSSFLILLAVVIGILSLATCDDKLTDTAEKSPADPFPFPQSIPLEESLKAPSEVPDDLQIIWEVWNHLAREYVDRSELEAESSAEAAIIGMLKALNDPHTGYVKPEAFDIQNEDLQGKFQGIGANVSLRSDGKLLIVAPLAGGPAEAAGLRPGDIVLEVDGKSIAGLSLLEAVSLIRGPKGTEVKLLVQHLGALDPTLIAVTRDSIPLASVLIRSDPGDQIAHVRVTSFYADTADVMAQTIGDAVANGAQGLIIDVRDNPGGLLSSVVDVTNHFLDDGLILYEVDSSGHRTEFEAHSGGVATDIPMVILANQFSASASEILVGALQDHQRATVIGTTTFGKASVNILRPLSNGGGLYLTFARWFTPLGRPIQGVGLKPDIEVDSRDRQKAEATQLEKAIEVLESQLIEKSTSRGAT